MTLSHSTASVRPSMRMAAVAAAFAGALAHGAVNAAETPGRPSAEDYLRAPAYLNVSLSPDGKSLAALVPINGHRNVALVDLDRRGATAVTSQDADDVATYRWLGSRVVEVVTTDLDETGGALRIHQHVLIDVVDKIVLRDLLAKGAGNAEILWEAPGDGSDLVIESFGRGRLPGADAYRYNIRTGEQHLLTLKSPGDVRRFVADQDGQVRIAVSSPRGSLRTIVSYRKGNDDAWTTLRDDPTDEETLDPIAFDYDGRTLYVRVPSTEHAGKRDVVAFDTETGKLGAKIFEAEGVDAGAVVVDRVQKKVVGVHDGSKGGIHWIDPRWRQIQKAIDEVLPNAHNHLSWARENTDRVVIASEGEAKPVEFFLFDVKTLTLEPVGKSRPWLKPDDLAPRRFVTYAARDGLTIPAYLTTPQRPDGAKPPLIVDIHGGPFVRAEGFGYDGEAEFLASRGYAVLQPDFRGTKGYGLAFEKAGWRQWGLAMQDDLSDGVRWLVETGQVDGDRVCLYGASYGGYATLWGLEKEPTMFRCGVAFLAVSDLELMFDVTWSDFMRYDRYDDAKNYLTRVLGDPDRDREKLRAASPDRHADRIQAPLLLAYGGTDQRVPLVHGLKMRSALDDAHKPYEWVEYNDQKHTFFDPVNRADFYSRVEAFLAKNLAPRADVQAVATRPVNE